MARVRYGPRTEADIAAAKSSRAVLPDIWSTGVVAVWESDPDAVAQVLPPPLKPAERSLVRVWRRASFRSPGALYRRARSASLRLGVGLPLPAVTAPEVRSA